MPLLRPPLFAALLALLLITPAHADTTPAAPAATTTPSLAEQTQSFQDQLRATETSLETLNEQLAKAPRQIRDAEQALAHLRATPAVDVEKSLAGADPAELEKRLNSQTQELSGWQSELSDANSLVIAAQTRPERAQAEIASRQARLQDVENLLSGTSGTKENGQPLAPERLAALKAEQAALKATIELRRHELAGNSLLLNLGKARRDLLTEQISRAQQETQALQGLLNNKRRQQSEQTVAELSKAAAAPELTSNALLAKESAENLTLSSYLLRGTEQLNEVTQNNLKAQQQLDSLNQISRYLDEQIAVLGGNQILSKILIQQQQALPDIELDPNLASNIADLRLYQFDLNQRLENITDPQAYIDRQLLTQPQGTDTPELRKALQDLLQNRSDLMQQLEQLLSSLLSGSVTLQVNQKQLQNTAQDIRKTINEQMFWIPSNKPLSWSWLTSLPEHLKAQLEDMPWTSVLSQLQSGLLKQPLFFLPLLVLMAGMLWKRRAISQRLDSISKSIGHYARDSQLNTPIALLLNLLLALPAALALALCGFALEMDGRGQNASLSAAFFQMAQACLVFYTAYLVLSPGHMAEVHFRWPAGQVRFLRREIGWLGIVVMVMVAIVTFAMHQPAVLANDVLGLIAVLVCYLLTSLGLVRVLFRGPYSDNASLARQAMGLLFCLLPLTLAVAVGLGYYYTALRLTGRLADTLYLVLLWILLEAVLVRSLSVAARRLAYQRMQEKRRRQAEEDQEQGEIRIEEPVIDIEQLNQQSLRLMRITLFGSFVAVLYWIWSDLISVVSYLDNFILYTIGSGDTATAISLRDVLSGLLIGGISILLARNLPGLLEVFVLSRMKLGQGSAYATSTLLTYALIALGATSTLAAVGVKWDQLQWLVAALSVGLGFGLQEIFANFVSGLIILFERPVRIGDLVTINSLTGTVTRIKIRATTITDADRKEIIVPNKSFITSQLVNWTLTDTVTRLVIKVGVAYGSDLALVRQLLLKVADDNPRVLADPAPDVWFLNFGESTLDHELRVHVRELKDRMVTWDELNRAIDGEFSRHGIEIAFNQLDIYVKNLESGQQLHLPGPAGSGPAAEPGQRQPEQRDALEAEPDSD